MKGSHEARKRILVVDDEESIRRTLKLLLESEGYEVITANNGKDGLAKLREGLGFDLALVDFYMDGMDGLAFCSEARLNSSTRGIKLAFLTVAGFTRSDQKNLDNLKISAFFHKPFDNNDLLRGIKKIVG